MAKKAVKKVPAKKATSKKVDADKLKPAPTGRTFKAVSVGSKFWKPEAVGEVIEGKYVKTDQRQKYKGKKGETQDHVVLQDGNDKVWILPSHWQINAAVTEHGEGYYQFVVERLGKQSTKKGEKSTSYEYGVGYSKK